MSDVATRCPACGGTMQLKFSAVDLHHGLPGTFSVSVCDVCGTGVTLPLVHAHELGQYYPKTYYTHKPQRGIAGVLKTLEARRYDRRLGLDRLSPGRLLEIGPGDCALLLRMKARGWDVQGLDPDPLVVENGAKLGLDVRLGSFSNIQDGPYDVIVAWQSLEHSVTPAEDIRKIAQHLKTSGRVILGVPDFGSRIARHFGNAWSHLDVPRHRTHFTRAGLDRLLRSNGLDPNRIGSWVHPYAIIASWRFKRGQRMVRIVDAAIASILLTIPGRLLELLGRGDLIAVEAAPTSNTEKRS